MTRRVMAGSVAIGGGSPVTVQSMTNTDTRNIEATVEQIRCMAAAGADIVRVSVYDEDCVRAVRSLVEQSPVPLVADIHFDHRLAIGAVENGIAKVRINPGNFHKDHEKACEQFRRLISVCKACGTAIRIGLNHGSLGSYIVEKYGNTPEAMALAAMEWVRICAAEDFREVVVSLKASNTVVMTEAYRHLRVMMEAEGILFPLHVGVTEAGNGDSGRIKSCVAISALLSQGIGDTIRVSLSADHKKEIEVGYQILKSQAAIGSGGNYALAAPRALVQNTDLSAKEIAEKALHIAASICVYTNDNIIVEEV